MGWAEKKAQTNNASSGNPQAQAQTQARPVNAGSSNAQKGNSKSVETAQIHVSFISKQVIQCSFSR